MFTRKIPALQYALQSSKVVGMAKKRKKMKGTIQRIIKPIHPGMSEKAEIAIQQAEDLYKEIRIENEVTAIKARRQD
jgi:hypothetical protein